MKSEYFAGEAHHCIFQKTCTPSLVSSAIDSDSPHVCKQPYDLPASLQVRFFPPFRRILREARGPLAAKRLLHDSSAFVLSSADCLTGSLMRALPRVEGEPEKSDQRHQTERGSRIARLSDHERIAPHVGREHPVAAASLALNTPADILAPLPSALQ